jgi:hypothetical protein
MTVKLINKLVYIKASRVSKLFTNIKADALYNQSSLVSMKYHYDVNKTSLQFNYDTYYCSGNIIPKIIDILNRDYTKGVIIEEDDSIKELF